MEDSSPGGQKVSPHGGTRVRTHATIILLPVSARMGATAILGNDAVATQARTDEPTAPGVVSAHCR